MVLGSWQPWLAWAVIGVGLLLWAPVLLGRWRPSAAAALVTAAGLRVAMAVAAYGRTPHDVTVYFRATGEALLHGHDPVVSLARYQWNFLLLMPGVHAAEIETGLPWQVAVKLAPILADLVVVVLLGRLAPPAVKPLARWAYAVSPGPVLVSAWHGQVEPVAAALALGALLLARRRPAAAGLCLGAAIAAKTWPVLYAPGVLRESRRRSWPVLVAAACVLPVVLLAVSVVALHSPPKALLSRLLGYRSYTGAWGWAGLRYLAGKTSIGYTGFGIAREGALALLVTLVVLIAVYLRRWRLADGASLTLTTLLVELVFTAGFGLQYLDWPFALLSLRRDVASVACMLAIDAFLAVDYLRLLNRPDVPTQVYASLPVVALLAVAALTVPRRLASGRPAVAR